MENHSQYNQTVYQTPQPSGSRCWLRSDFLNMSYLTLPSLVAYYLDVYTEPWKAKDKRGCKCQSPRRTQGSGKISSGQRKSGSGNGRAQAKVRPRWRFVSKVGYTEKPRVTHFIVLQAVDHQLRENDHAGPSHPSTAVDDNGRVLVLGAFQHAVGMATDRLDLLQVGCKTKCKSCHESPTWLCIQARGKDNDGESFFFFFKWQ